jgi:hypothetical protein
LARWQLVRMKAVANRGLVSGSWVPCLGCSAWSRLVDVGFVGCGAQMACGVGAG